MKILVVTMDSVENTSSAMIRLLGVLKGFIDNRHVVTMLCLEKNAGGTNIDTSKYRFLQKVKIIRLKKWQLREVLWRDPKCKDWKSKIVNFLRKIYHSLSIFGATYQQAKNVKIDVLGKETSYDVVISSSDPKTSHIAVKRLIQQGLKTKKWIEYWGDPLAVDMTKLSIYPQFALKIVERCLIKGET